MKLPNKFSENVKIAAIGEFNAGKSSLINSLLGERVLPVDIFQTTATINFVSHGDVPRLKIMRADGSAYETDLSELQNFNAEKGQFTDVSHLEIYHPHIMRDVTIVDTPGFNDPDPERDRKFYSILPFCDAILFVTDINQPLKSSEIPFLSSQYASLLFNRTYFILNHTDQIGELHRVADAVRYVSRTVSEISKLTSGAIQDKTFAVCSEPSRIIHLQQDLRDHLGGNFMRLLNSLQELATKKNLLLQESDIRARIFSASEQLRTLEETKSALLARQSRNTRAIEELLARLQKQREKLTSFLESSLEYRRAVSEMLTLERQSLLADVRERLGSQTVLRNPLLAQMEIKKSLTYCIDKTTNQFMSLSTQYLGSASIDGHDLHFDLEKQNIHVSGIDKLERAEMDMTQFRLTGGSPQILALQFVATTIASIFGPGAAYLVGALSQNLLPMIHQNNTQSEYLAALDQSVNNAVLTVDKLMGDFVRIISEKEEHLIAAAQRELAGAILKRQWAILHTLPDDTDHAGRDAQLSEVLHQVDVKQKELNILNNELKRLY